VCIWIISAYGVLLCAVGLFSAYRVELRGVGYLVPTQGSCVEFLVYLLRTELSFVDLDCLVHTEYSCVQLHSLVHTEFSCVQLNYLVHTEFCCV